MLYEMFLRKRKRPRTKVLIASDHVQQQQTNYPQLGSPASRIVTAMVLEWGRQTPFQVVNTNTTVAQGFSLKLLARVHQHLYSVTAPFTCTRRGSSVKVPTISLYSINSSYDDEKEIHVKTAQ
jgi:hypothetical protein